jgi:hypothetical protein
MQRTSIVYTLKVVKILAYEEEIPNYVQISCIGDVCSWDTETNEHMNINSNKNYREKIIYHKKK